MLNVYCCIAHMNKIIRFVNRVNAYSVSTLEHSENDFPYANSSALSVLNTRELLRLTRYYSIQRYHVHAQNMNIAEGTHTHTHNGH